MRRQVRFYPLGSAAKIILRCDGDSRAIEADVVDESVSGLGLRLGSPLEVKPGQLLHIKNREGNISAVVIRVESLAAGGTRLGVRIQDEPDTSS